MLTAKEFYGSTYDKADAARQVLLNKAVKYLDMALRAEAEPVPGSSKLDMAFNAAVKAEAETFAIVK